MDVATSSEHSGFDTFYANVEELSGLGAMTCVLPMRKIISIFWKPALKKKKRGPSTLVDCLEVSKMRNVTSLCRPWLSVVLGLALMYSLYALMNKIPPQTTEDFDDRDIQVIRYISSTKACGYGCNLAEVSSKTNISIADLVTRAKAAPRTARRLAPCSRHKDNDDDDGKIRYALHRLDFKNRKNIKAGGYYRPRDCEARSKVAVIVPYRDREINLLVLLYNIHPFLIKQMMLQYRIFVIEQYGHEKFNKGRLLNAGFDQAGRFGSWDCLVFHDVNLLPLYANTSYSCPIAPTQLSTSVVRLNQTYPHPSSFGGVTSITFKHFRAVNGFSNQCWGSVGADESDMFLRLRAARIPIKKYEKLMGRYAILPPPTEKKNTTRHERISTGNTQKRRDRYKTDGLVNSNYKTISIKLRSLYTHIVVDINPNKDSIE